MRWRAGLRESSALGGGSVAVGVGRQAERFLERLGGAEAHGGSGGWPGAKSATVGMLMIP